MAKNCTLAVLYSDIFKVCVKPRSSHFCCIFITESHFNFFYFRTFRLRLETLNVRVCKKRTFSLLQSSTFCYTKTISLYFHNAFSCPSFRAPNMFRSFTVFSLTSILNKTKKHFESFFFSLLYWFESKYNLLCSFLGLAKE